MLSKYLGFRGSKNKSSSKKHSPTIIEEQCHQFLLEDLRKSTNNFDKKLVIGERVLATWYKGCLKQHDGATDSAIELKRMHGPDIYCEDEFKREITLLCQLCHPNIVSLIGFCKCKEEMIIVYDNMPNGSLHDHLYSKDMEPLSWKKRLEICIGIARGLHYLHAGVKRSVVHRGVMPANIRLDKNMVPKISDFGGSIQGALSTSKPKPIVDSTIFPSPYRNAHQYIAPECFASRAVTDKHDVYAFGKVLLQMVCITDDQMIFNKAETLVNQQWGESGKEYLREFTNNGYLALLDIETFLKRLPIEEIIDPILKKKIAPECWEVFVDVTQGCMKYEPDERPTMGEVEVLLEHALSLQEDADIKKTDGDYYTLLSTTYINPQPVICIDAQELFCHQFSLDDLRQTTYNFTREKGLVKLNGPTPIPIVVKKIHWPYICCDGEQWDFKKEIEKIWQLRHPNLASLLGVCDHYDEKILVYMYFDGEDLDSYLFSMESLTWKKRLVTCIEVSQGLDYLHKATIFHRNLKLSNILLDDDMVPKLINFGLPWTNPLYAGLYFAPELFQGHDFTCKCDVYSFGLVLLQMIFVIPQPICKENIYRILKGKIALQCCEVFLYITQQCSKREANERPTMSEVKTQLQYALALQEEASANTTGDYKLPTTFDARVKAFAWIQK